MEFKPFKGVRPCEELAKNVATENVSNYKKAALSKVISESNHTFLNVIGPTIESKPKDRKESFARVREKFDEFVKEEILVEDRKSFYIYRQTLPDGRCFSGVIGLLDLNEKFSDSLKELEKTLERRVDLFTEYLESVNFQADPVVVSYEEKHRVSLLLEVEMKKTPLIEFTSEDESIHQLWRVDNTLVIGQIKDSIKKLDKLYVLDGHHRLQSTRKYRLLKKEQDEDFMGLEDYNYILTFLIADSQVQINGYHRLIKDLNGLSEEKFLEELGKVCKIVPRGEKLYYPSDKHYAVLYMKGEYYTLFFGSSLETGLKKLDVDFLQTQVLEKILQIKDASDKSRLQYFPGTGNEEALYDLKEKVDSGECVAAFGLFAPPMNDLFDLGSEEYLPPKSFYILPRLLSGLVVFDPEED